MDNTNGIIMFNKNEKVTVRALVSLYTIRQHYDGPITFFIETSPTGFIDSVKYFGCDVIEPPENKDLKTLCRKTQLFQDTPYDNTLWLDSDTALVGKIDEMFEYLENYDVAIPHFANWWSDGKIIKRRIMNFKEHVSSDVLAKSLEHKPAVNTGVVAYRKDSQFIKEWINLTINTNGLCFISDEISFQVLYPSFQGIYVAPMKFNVSARFGNDVEDKRIIHFHGSKHCIPQFPLCTYWLSAFETMKKDNIANINYFIEKHSDRRLRKYLKGERVWGREEEIEADKEDGLNVDDEEVGTTINTIKTNKDVTIVTACDEKYVEILRETFPNWRKYKNIDDYTVMIFVNGISLDDSRLDFLRLPNVQLIPWSKEKDLDNVTDHREEMLSSFVFGPAKYVKTDYWLKLDADSYATNDKSFVTEEMLKYSLVSHRWGYSRPQHIETLDLWAKNHNRKELNASQPMIEQGRIDGKRFYHNKKRIISYICLQKTEFTRFCVSLLKERKLPCPSQDTYAYFIIQKFLPDKMKTENFKRHYGYTQGKGKWGAEGMRKKLEEIDNDFKGIINQNKQEVEINSEEENNSIKVDIIKTLHEKTENKPFITPEGNGVIIEIKEIK